MTAPKHIKPVKTAIDWPGKFHVGLPGNQYPWQFRCPRPFCFYVIVAPDEATLDERIEKHKCPWFGGGTTTYSWGVMSDSYLGPIWELLDAQVDIIMGGPAEGKNDDQNRFAMQQARYTARGIAESLAILMPPFFTTGDEIVKEAIRRREARVAGEDYETNGLGRLKWKRPPSEHDPDHPSWLTQEHDPAVVKSKAPVAAKPKHSLPEATVTLIKKSRNFPPEILATAYSVSIEVIQRIWEE